MSLIYTAPLIRTTPAGNTKPHSIYIGGKAEAKNHQFLDSCNISHILNVSGTPNYFENTGKYKYKRIDVSDDSTTDLLLHADSVVSFLSSGLHHGSVLVHCRQGISRSPSCVAFFLMRKGGMTLDRAMRTMKSRRPGVSPIPAFMEQLAVYESKCKQLGSIQTDGGKIDRGGKTSMIGPARPPMTAAASMDSDMSTTTAKPSISIGPSMPVEICSPASHEKVEMKIGPTLPIRPTQIIGPTRPHLLPNVENSVKSEEQVGAAVNTSDHDNPEYSPRKRVRLDKPSC